MKDLAYDLASHAVKTKYDFLPDDAIESTKKFILDTLATTIAGSSAIGCREVINQVNDWGGKEESTILIYRSRVPAPSAAFANSIMGHALDFDDTHDRARLHANVSVLPAALAMSDRIGGISGKDLITAVTIGVDIVCRIGLGTGEPLGWVSSSIAGYFGATVAASKVLDLDESKLLHALGIVYSQCAGNAQCSIDGGLVKRMQPAFAARAGILSSVLAEKAITGATNVFEGKYGFFPLYYGGKYNRNNIVKDLGRAFEGSNLSVKPYPCCRYTHCAIDSTLDIVSENNIDPRDIKEVIIHVTQNAYDFVGKPFEIRESPQVDAQFSIPYTVAVAIARRDVFIDDFYEDRIRTDNMVLQLAKKVIVKADQKPIAKGFTPCIVELRTKSGKTYSKHTDFIKGSPQQPLSMKDVGEKLKKCAAFSAKPISRGNDERLIKGISNLENVRNVVDILGLLT